MTASDKHSSQRSESFLMVQATEITDCLISRTQMMISKDLGYEFIDDVVLLRHCLRCYRIIEHFATKLN